MKSLIRASIAIAATASACAAAQTPPPDPCADKRTAQFNFWVGDWDVYVPSGKLVGTNRIEKIYGCVLHEHWKTPKMEGQSFNRFDPDRGVWHQTWVDSTGGLLMIEGGLKDGSMIMSDATLAGRKEGVVNEISWTLQPDGSVRQHWRLTKDGGKSWETSFDGKYVRSIRPQPQ